MMKKTLSGPSATPGHHYIWAIFLHCVLLLSLKPVAAQSGQLQYRLDSLLRAASFNGNILITDHGQPLLNASYGFASFRDTAINTPDAAFQTASISKIFTAIAILQLAEQKKLQSDAPVQQYLPDFPYAQITIRHLLQHSSGLPDLGLFETMAQHDPERRISKADIIPALKQENLSLQFSPGSQYQYCNTGYQLLALLVERISGQSFPDYLRRHVFLPAKMNNTFVRTEGQQINVKNHILFPLWSIYPQDADSIRLRDKRRMRRIRYEGYNLGLTQGDQNVVSTTGDLLRFITAWKSGKLLTAKMQQLSTTPLVLNNGKIFSDDFGIPFGKQSGYGMGWIVSTDAQHPFIGHDGYNRGIQTLLFHDISTDRNIILFDNTENPLFNPLISNILRLLNGEPLQSMQLKRSAVRYFGDQLLHQPAAAALIRFNEFRTDTAQYYFDVREMNQLGYDLMNNDHLNEALQVFFINIVLNPTKAGYYDSYGEALANCGRINEAISMYEKAVSLDSAASGSVRALQALKEKLKTRP